MSYVAQRTERIERIQETEMTSIFIGPIYGSFLSFFEDFHVSCLNTLECNDGFHDNLASFIPGWTWRTVLLVGRATWSS